MNTLIESSIQLKCLLAILALLSALAYAIAMMLKSFSHQAPYKNIYDLTLGAMLVAFLASYFLLMDPYLASEEAVQTTAEILLYGSALPLPFTFWAFYKERKWPYLLDAVALVFLWPCLIFSKPFLFPYFFSAFYLFLRAILLAFVSFRTIKNSLNRYTIKAVLDTLPWGLLIARKDGRPAYINDAFKLILAEWNISPHQKLAEIEQALRQQAAFSLASDSVIIPFYGAYLLLKKNTEGSWISLSFHVVTEEVLLNEEIRQTNATLQAEKLTLEKTLDELKSLAHGKEKERLRALVHDSFADEVSFIHQILTNPTITNLGPLKELIHKGLGNEKVDYADLDEMEGFYALLGVHFTNIGTLEGCPDEEAALQFVREATDNAIRHGNATEITITAKKLDEAFLLEVANNGSVPADLVFHNGLSSLKATLEEEGGELTLVTTPSFAIAARFPYSH